MAFIFFILVSRLHLLPILLSYFTLPFNMQDFKLRLHSSCAVCMYMTNFEAPSVNSLTTNLQRFLSKFDRNCGHLSVGRLSLGYWYRLLYWFYSPSFFRIRLLIQAFTPNLYLPVTNGRKVLDLLKWWIPAPTFAILSIVLFSNACKTVELWSCLCRQIKVILSRTMRHSEAWILLFMITSGLILLIFWTFIFSIFNQNFRKISSNYLQVIWNHSSKLATFSL